MGHGGFGAAYCARRMCPWNSKKERSSAVVASRWMLPTLTLVFSMAAAPGFFVVWLDPAKGAKARDVLQGGWFVRYHP